MWVAHLRRREGVAHASCLKPCRNNKQVHQEEAGSLGSLLCCRASDPALGVLLGSAGAPGATPRAPRASPNALEVAGRYMWTVGTALGLNHALHAMPHPSTWENAQKWPKNGTFRAGAPRW